MPACATQAASRVQPLAFTAAKSRLGHAETGAGVLGMLHAWWQLSRSAAPAITHLRTINAYVEGSLQRSQGAVFLPRQAAAGLSASELCTGISSFAFQVGGWVGGCVDASLALVGKAMRASAHCRSPAARDVTSCHCRAPIRTCCWAGRAAPARTSRQQRWLLLNSRGSAAASGPALWPTRFSAAACQFAAAMRLRCCCKPT